MEERKNHTEKDFNQMELDKKINEIRNNIYFIVDIFGMKYKKDCDNIIKILDNNFKEDKN